MTPSSNTSERDTSPFSPAAERSGRVAGDERDSGRPPQGGATLLGVVDFLTRNVRIVAAAGIACAVTAFTLTLIRGPVYIAESRFVPQTSNSSNSRLAGLAAQFGIDVGAAGAQSPSELYASLAGSREILEQVARESYVTTSDTGSAAPHASLISLLKLHNQDVEQLHLDAVEALRKRVSVSTDVRTGIVTLRTTTPWRRVSEQMNRRIIALVTDFNQNRRQSQARAEREFLEGRTREAQSQLREAEGRLAAFNDQNRVRASSQLALEAGRLQRSVDLAQQVFVMLAQNYEQARIEEVRNTPVITVIDSPEGSAKRQRGLAKKTLIGMILGIALGLGVALLGEQLRRRQQEDPEQFEELHARVSALFPRRRARSGR